MITTIGLARKPRCRRDNKSRAPALRGCPQKRAWVIRSFETTPRKPNSAKRKVAKVRLSNRRRLDLYLEGMGFNRLPPHSLVLVRGRGPRDTPGVRYHAIRGVYDFPALKNRRKRRSKYGAKRHEVLDKAKRLALPYYRRKAENYLMKYPFCRRNTRFFVRY